MKLKKIFVLSCLSVIMFSATVLAKPTELSINVNIGDKYSIHIVRDEDTRITFDSGETKSEEVLEMNMNIYIKDVDKDKNLSIDCEYESIRLSKEIFGKKVEYDTDNKNINNSLNDMYKEFIGKKFTIILNNKGKILNLNGVNELLTSIANTKGTSKEEKLFIKGELNKKFGDEIVTEAIKKTINYYPEKNVEIEEVWETQYDLKETFPINYFNKFKILSEKDSTINIDMKSNINSNTKNFMESKTNVNMTGEGKGIIEMEKATGMPKKLHFNRVINGYLESESDGNNVEKVVIPIKVTETLIYEFVKK